MDIFRTPRKFNVKKIGNFGTCLRSVARADEETNFLVVEKFSGNV